MKFPEQSLLAKPELLFCTLHGSIGVIASLEESTFMILDALQKAMGGVARGIGGLEHSRYTFFLFARFRQFQNGQSKKDLKGFIDGDFVETFYDLDLESQRAAIELMNLNVTIDNVKLLIEEVARVH